MPSRYTKGKAEEKNQKREGERGNRNNRRTRNEGTCDATVREGREV